MSSMAPASKNCSIQSELLGQVKQRLTSRDCQGEEVVSKVVEIIGNLIKFTPNVSVEDQKKAINAAANYSVALLNKRASDFSQFSSANSSHVTELAKNAIIIGSEAKEQIATALGLVASPIPSNTAEVETADGINSASETAAATDEASAAHANKLQEFSTAFKPVFDHAAKIENEDDRNKFLKNFFDLMEQGLSLDSSEEADSESNSQTIAQAFEGLFNQEGSQINTDQLNTAIQKLSAEEKKELETYLHDLKDAIINGGVGTLTSFAIENHETQKLTAIALEKVKKNPLSRLTTGVDTETLQNQKAYVSAAVVALSRIAENQVRAREAQGIRADKAQVFAEVFTKENLQEAIFNLEDAGKIFGVSEPSEIEIYHDDIQPIASYLKNSKPKNEAQHENSVKHMLDNYGKVAFAVAPFLLAPLAAVLNKIPVVGRPVAGLINMFYGVFEKVGTPLMFALMGGEKSKQASDDHKSPTSA
jgi:hypothetical protein